jgi:hypothetical protein
MKAISFFKALDPTRAISGLIFTSTIFRVIFRILSNQSNRFSAAVIMKIAYGHDIKDDDDLYLRLGTHANESIEDCGPLGSTPIDFFPFRKPLPRLSILAKLIGFSDALSFMVSGNVLCGVCQEKVPAKSSVSRLSIRRCQETACE